MTGPDLYRILQVHPEADADVIQAAYRRLARKLHPDTPGGSDARMAELNAAYAVLNDRARRAEYDRQRLREIDLRTAADAASAEAAASRAPGGQGGSAQGPAPRRPPPVDERSPDWTSGRSMAGGGYDPATMSRPQAQGSAGPPPGHPSGSVINFGRYAGWSLGEIARTDLEFLEWLDRMTIGRTYQQEIDTLLRRAGRRRTSAAQPDRPGLFRRR
ncbi:MAG TPA: J domain-containing protein [Candidatus Limnocylindrales bacterium]|nr:J domain-containing protein [Candidatus Limnocylindrales bacterium]